MNKEEAGAARPLLVVALSGRVAGIDAETGEIRWRNELKGGGLNEVFLAVERDRVFVSAEEQKLFCLDYLSGRTIWEATTEGVGRATIVVQDDRVYVAKQGTVDCFAWTGERLWSQPLRGFGYGRVALGFPGNVRQADDAG